MYTGRNSHLAQGQQEGPTVAQEPLGQGQVSASAPQPDFGHVPGAGGWLGWFLPLPCLRGDTRCLHIPGAANLLAERTLGGWSPSPGATGTCRSMSCVSQEQDTKDLWATSLSSSCPSASGAGDQVPLCPGGPEPMCPGGPEPVCPRGQEPVCPGRLSIHCLQQPPVYKDHAGASGSFL